MCECVHLLAVYLPWLQLSGVPWWWLCCVGVAGLWNREEEEDLTFSCRLAGEIKQFSLCCVSLYHCHCLLPLLSIWSRAGCTCSVILLLHFLFLRSTLVSSVSPLSHFLSIRPACLWHSEPQNGSIFHSLASPLFSYPPLWLPNIQLILLTDGSDGTEKCGLWLDVQT